MMGQTIRFLLAAGATALALGLFAGACGDGGGGSASGAKCEPGENIFCRCPGGDAGTKTCKADGQSFEECVTRAGPCPTIGNGGGGSGGGGATGGSGGSGATGGTGGSGGATGGTGGGSAGNALYTACNDDAECESMDCRFGFCTQGCAKYDDCVLGKGECVPVKGVLVCTPTCQLTSDCEGKYNPPSQCGFAETLDGWGVTTCADWLDALQLPPDGSDCADDPDCNLGNEGHEWVCAFNACTSGCYQPTDCPSGKTCSSMGSLGKCQ